LKKRPGHPEPAPKLTAQQAEILDERLLAIDQMMKTGDNRPLSEPVVREIVERTAKNLHSTRRKR